MTPIAYLPSARRLVEDADLAALAAATIVPAIVEAVFDGSAAVSTELFIDDDDGELVLAVLVDLRREPLHRDAAELVAVRARIEAALRRSAPWSLGAVEFAASPQLGRLAAEFPLRSCRRSAAVAEGGLAPGVAP